MKGSCENDIVDFCMLYLKLTREESERYITAFRQKHPDVEITPGYKKDYEQKKEAFKLIDVLKAFITSQVEMIQWIVNQVKCTVQMASAYLDEYQQEFGAIPGLC